jgi:hypothetical protein
MICEIGKGTGYLGRYGDSLLDGGFWLQRPVGTRYCPGLHPAPKTSSSSSTSDTRALSRCLNARDVVLSIDPHIYRVENNIPLHILSFVCRKMECHIVFCAFARQVATWGSEFCFKIRFQFLNLGQRLRWSRGSLLTLSTQVRGFKPGRNRQDF